MSLAPSQADDSAVSDAFAIANANGRRVVLDVLGHLGGRGRAKG